jgi:HAMP domain-containing protein
LRSAAGLLQDVAKGTASEGAAVGLRTKFNLLLLGVALIGAGLFSLAAEPLVNAVAREEVLQSSRIMMESAAGARKYTSEQIAPILKPMIGHRFYPQSVSAYAAKRNFDVIHAKFPDFSYREAALNPTNPQDRATDWEADIINDFRAHPGKEEDSLVRSTATGPMLELARPLVNKPACMECHSTAASAPASMIALYGNENGFGWKPGEIIGAQIVSVPMSASAMRASHIRSLFVIPFVAFLALLFVSVNVLLNFVVVRPIEKIAKTAEAISLGEMKTPEYKYRRSDQIGRLSASFNRMHRSLVEAFRMLGEE